MSTTSTRICKRGRAGYPQTGLWSRRILAVALLLMAALLSDRASAKEGTAGADRQGAGQSEIRLGMSADFSASARALSIELYRGAMAYLLPVNNTGVNDRRLVIKAYDDQYEPDLAIRNTLKLMDEDDVFARATTVFTTETNSCGVCCDRRARVSFAHFGGTAVSAQQTEFALGERDGQ